MKYHIVTYTVRGDPSPQDGNTDKRLLLALALALLALPAILAVTPGEADGLEHGSTYRSGVTDYYVVTDPGSRTYTNSTLPSPYIYVDCASVKARAFANCTSLMEVIFSPQVKTVGTEAFRGCTGLYSVEARYVETVGTYAFAESSLYYIGFGGSLTSLGAHAFDGCSRMTNFPTWSTSLTELGDYVLRGTGITVIDLRGIQTVSPTALSGLTIRAQVADSDQTVFVDGAAIVYLDDRNYISSISAGAKDISVSVRTSGYRITVQDIYGQDVEIRESINPPFYSFHIPYEAGGVYTVSKFSYTITFPESMGISPVSLESGQGSVQLPHPDIEAMTGWTLDGSSSFWSISESTMSSIGRTVALKALITGLVQTYDHSAISERTDVSLIASQRSFIPGDAFGTLPDVVGYDFAGWEVDGEEYQTGDDIPKYESHTARSLWTATIVYTVSYPELGIEDSVEYGAPYSVTIVVPEEEDSQRFLGWAMVGTDGVIGSGEALAVTADIVLSPVFEDRQAFTVVLADGEDTVSETQVYDGRTYILAVPDPIGDFRIFKHWACGSETYARGDSFEVTGDMVLEAVWIDIPTSSITYHVGDSEVVKRYCTGSEVTVYCEAQPPVGMVLSGWSVEDGSATASYASGSSCTLSEDIGLWPVWAEGDRETVTFHGTVSGDVSVRLIPGTEREVTETAPQRSHFTFLGWSPSASSASADYRVGSVVVASGDIALYPVYREDAKATVIHVTGSGSTERTVYVGTTIVTEGAPAKEGSTFAGWRDAASSAVYRAGVSLAVESDMVLVAEWTPVPAAPTTTTEPVTKEQGSTAPVTKETSKGTATVPVQKDSYAAPADDSPPKAAVSAESGGSSSGLKAVAAVIATAAVAAAGAFVYVFLRRARSPRETPSRGPRAPLSDRHPLISHKHKR